MRHCKNYKIKCKDNKYPWCSSQNCPHYEYNGLWTDSVTEEYIDDVESLSGLIKLYKAHLDLPPEFYKNVNEFFWELV